MSLHCRNGVWPHALIVYGASGFQGLQTQNQHRFPRWICWWALMGLSVLF